MKVGELILELNKFPADAIVRRVDWVCGGQTHYDYQDEEEIAKVEFSKDYKGSVVLR